jgi:alkylation response protein AidB-like acyl-CoA dehydrogenase
VAGLAEDLVALVHHDGLDLGPPEVDASERAHPIMGTRSALFVRSASVSPPVELNDTPELAEYRAKVRAWLEEHAGEAPVLRGPGAIADEREAVARHREWQRRLAEAGLAAVTWPAEYGGQGLGPLHQVVVNQEIGRAGVPGLFDIIGVGMLGPTVIAHGSEDQKQRHLGPMLAADEVWCQLFSEPAAGSDLAAIQTRARRDEDEAEPVASPSGRDRGSWRVSGQKVWTTNAQHAAFGLLLARTDADVPKHKGLTMFVLPMDAPGVTVRPLRQISGDAHFNEVFLDDVRLPPGSEVGPVDGGWGVAMTTLMFERVAIGLGGEGFGWRADRFAHALLEDEAAMADPEVRHRFGAIAADFLALRFTGYRMLTTLQRGGIPGPEGALAKVTTIRAAIAAGELVADVLGPDGLADDKVGELVSDMPGLKSAGGTEEILRSMVGERVLGLPPEPRLDKGIPFSELRAREREGLSS